MPFRSCTNAPPVPSLLKVIQISVVSAILTVVAMPTVPASAEHRSPSLTCSGSWTVMGSPDLSREGNVLQGVWAASATDVWAVGGTYDMDEPVVEHYTGSGWVLVSVPIAATEDALHAISGNTSTVWAVGDFLAREGYRMLTLRWDGSSWSRAPTPDIFGPDRLYAVSAGTNRPTWAVGSHYFPGGPSATVILRRENAKWVRVPSSNPGSYSNILEGVRSVSPTLAWAVGDAMSDGTTDHPLIERWDGSTWTAVTDPAIAGLQGQLSGVISPTPSTVLAVGWYRAGGPMVLYYDGTAWSVASPGPSTPASGFYGISGDGAGGAWAVGQDMESGGNMYTLIEHGLGADFTRASSPNPDPNSDSLHAVSTRSGVSWAVGYYGVDWPRTLIEYRC
jgi:hypothetical protein